MEASKQHSDKDVFVNEGLAEALEGDWEHVEADAGYRSQDTKLEELQRRVVTKGMYHTREDGHDNVRTLESGMHACTTINVTSCSWSNVYLCYIYVSFYVMFAPQPKSDVTMY
jgi:hypothetical protein